MLWNDDSISPILQVAIPYISQFRVSRTSNMSELKPRAFLIFKIMNKKYAQNERPKHRTSALLTMAMLLLSVGILAQTHLGQQMASAADVCQNLQVSSVSASGEDGKHVPENTLDGNIKNRWSDYGVGSWINYDLGSSQTICFVDIDWYKGDDRNYDLVISVSEDGTSYTDVYSGKSSGETGLYERYDFDDISARHVKLTINGNNNNKWNSISEVQIFGSTVDVVPPAPTGGSDDTVAPSISAPADVTKEATGPFTPADLGTATVSDNVDTDPTVTNNAPAAGFPLGVTTVTWTATDDSGNSATATQKVTINDTTAPSINAPEDKVATATGTLTAVSLGSPSVSDAVDSTPTVTSDAPAAGFPLGETQVTWTAKDDAGNTATDVQKVTVSSIIIPSPSGGSEGGDEFSILGVKASSDDGNVPENTMDDNLSTRWSAYGMGSWITVELSKSVPVQNVSIAWYNGANRVNDFVVATSEDGTTFANVYSGKSSGMSTQFEGYDTNDKTAKHVKITVTGNSQNNWASITEIAVNGAQAYYEPEPEPEPTPTPTPTADTTPTPTPTTDTTLPTVAIIFPANGATVSGSILGEATASDNVGISNVAGFMDTSALNVESFAPYEFAIDTTKYANGLHKFKVTATDTSGNKASHEITINVDNVVASSSPTPTADTTLPSVSIKSPTSGQSFSSGTTSVTVSGTASDNVGVTLVEKSINGGPYSSASGTTSWSFAATGLTDGQSYTATVRAKDANGNTKSAMVSFSVQSSASLPPPPSGGSDGTDQFGLKMLYPTKTGGEQWFMSMANPDGDSRFDPKNSITKNADGSWKMKSSQVRMNVFTSTGYQPTKITTYAQNQLATKGYMQSTNDWKNVEMTGFVKVNAANEDNFAWYTRGGKHTDSNGGCEGTSYKIDLYYSGKVRFAKEQQHADGYSFTASKTATSSIKGEWIGLKGIMYNNAQGNVVLETWLSEDNGATWKKVDSKVDSGGWGSDGDMCDANTPDQKITWGGPIATFRWDSASDVDFKWLSVREIQPPT